MSAPFDAEAPGYDSAFTHTRLGRALRGRVWARLAQVFAPGDCVLELACGTGEDARHLAQRGVRVVATDQSAAMLEVARAKTAGLPVALAPLDVLDPKAEPAITAGAPYDGVLSNFGGLNVLADYAPLARFLAPLVRPAGRLVLVVMGRWCAWEIGWHLARLRPRAAFRRLARGGAVARVGGASAHDLRVYYPTTGQLRRAFAPAFRLDRVWPLGLALPPTYLEPLTRRRFFPWRVCTALESLPWPMLGDHTVYEFVRGSIG